MGRPAVSAEDVISACFAAFVAGALIAISVGLCLLGYAWWGAIPQLSWGAWVYIPAVGCGVVAWLYMLWLFLSGELLQSEMWSRIGGLLTSGVDS
jgi:multisubunit Na+/H+ antiporter MnhB subunit